MQAGRDCRWCLRSPTDPRVTCGSARLPLRSPERACGAVRRVRRGARAGAPRETRVGRGTTRVGRGGGPGFAWWRPALARAGAPRGDRPSRGALRADSGRAAALHCGGGSHRERRRLCGGFAARRSARLRGGERDAAGCAQPTFQARGAHAFACVHALVAAYSMTPWESPTLTCAVDNISFMIFTQSVKPKWNNPAACACRPESGCRQSAAHLPCIRAAARKAGGGVTAPEGFGKSVVRRTPSPARLQEDA